MSFNGIGGRSRPTARWEWTHLTPDAAIGVDTRFSEAALRHWDPGTLEFVGSARGTDQTTVIGEMPALMISPTVGSQLLDTGNLRHHKSLRVVIGISWNQIKSHFHVKCIQLGRVEARCRESIIENNFRSRKRKLFVNFILRSGFFGN